MGLRGEVLDFVNAYTKTSDTSTKQKEAEDRSKYYESMEKTSQQNANTAERRAADTAENARGMLGVHRGMLGVAQGGLKLRQQQGAVGDIGDGDVPPAYAPAPAPQAVPQAAPAAPATANWGGQNAPVPSYAGGGAVEDTVSDDAAPVARLQAAAGAEGDDEDETRGAVGDDEDETEDNTEAFDPAETLQRWGVRGKEGKNPVAIGLEGIIKKFGLNAPKSGVDDESVGAHPGAKRLVSGEGAASDEELKAMNAAVDPDGKLSQSALTMARLDKAVNYWVDHGDMKKAATVAHALIIRGQLDTQKFGAAAAAAIQKGDMSSAVKFLKRAYDNVPDGKDLDASVDGQGQVHAAIVGPDGEKQDLGVFGPAQVFQLARGAQSGTEYYNRMAQIATGQLGQQQPKQAGAMKVADFNTLSQGVGQEVDDMKLGLEPGAAGAVKNGAVHLMTDPNNRRAGMTANEAAMAAGQIAIPDPKNPAQPNFKAAPAQDGSGMAVTFNDGRQVFVPKAQWTQLAAIRGQRLKAVEEKAAKEKAQQAEAANAQDKQERASAKVADEVGSMGMGL